MRGRVDDYVESRLLPHLRLAGLPFRVEIPAAGRRTLTFRIVTERGNWYLRCRERPLLGLRAGYAASWLTRRGLPVPRLVRADFSPGTWFRYGWFALAEEEAEGSLWIDVEPTPARLAAAGETLARFHSVTRRSWGLVMTGLGRRSRHLDERDREQGAAWLIDTVTKRFGHHTTDLEAALHHWCGNDGPRQETFLGAYFGVFTHVSRDAWERTRPWFRASFHLSQTDAALESVERRSARGDPGPERDAAAARATAHLGALAAMCEGWAAGVAQRFSDVAEELRSDDAP